MYVGNLEHQFHESLLHLVLWPSAVILEDSINACLPSRSTGINTTVLLPRALTHNISSGPCLSVTKKHKKIPISGLVDLSQERSAIQSVPALFPDVEPSLHPATNLSSTITNDICQPGLLSGWEALYPLGSWAAQVVCNELR